VEDEWEGDEEAQNAEEIADETVKNLGVARDEEEKQRAQENEPRTRKAISEIAFAGRWGEPWRPTG